ncbi:MAG: T9SS type A sorting domain-containing protein [Microscillaceae bacterium]|nr:T9SS type A sorting domain-containing protein [Microscillaceae bacterium]
MLKNSIIANLLIISYLSVNFVCAQIQLYPNHTPITPHKTSSKIGKGNEKSRTAPLNLPFFDDFTYYKSQSLPDTSLWLDKSGVFINNTFAVNPITIGVASFDGVNQFGVPYRFPTINDDVNNINIVGLTDTLHSCPINLAVHQPADSVYLSFYWQREGNEEAPDIIDSLRVQFKSADNQWHTVWTQSGGGNTAPFALALIPVKDVKYFFNQFQFRFECFGRQAGMYDAWHIDYVYLDIDRGNATFPIIRTNNNRFVDDIACSIQPNYFLKKYTAMPVKQYFANPAQETAVEFKSSVNNLSAINRGDITSYFCELNDIRNQESFGIVYDEPSFDFAGNTFQRAMQAPISANLIPNTPKKRNIELKFIVRSGDNDQTIPNYNLRRNDTVSTVSVLDDYYAYDDGTAEYGAGFGGTHTRFARLAYRFETNLPDTLTDVKIHLTQFNRDLVGQTFNLIIWKDIAIGSVAPRDSILFRVNVPIRYPSERNQLVSIEAIKRQSDPNFRFPAISVNGTFYVGYEQTGNEPITIGFDRNTDSSEEIFFNSINTWQRWTDINDVKGSLMIRPIFGEPLVTGVEPDIYSQIKVYPNPTSGRLTWEGLSPKQLLIKDLNGENLIDQTLENPSEKFNFDISSLPSGVYILQGIFANGKSVFKKIVVRK